jgi:hypothetical protein
MTKMTYTLVGQVRLELFMKNATVNNVATQFGLSYKAVRRIKECDAYHTLFTRFVNGRPTNEIIEHPFQKTRLNKWLSTKARRLKTTVNHIMELIIKSGGNCYFCNTALILGPQKGRPKNKTLLCIDHDHTTGKVRGVVCGSCNLRLGKYDSAFGRMVLNYLR